MIGGVFRAIFAVGLIAITVLSLHSDPPDTLVSAGDLIIHFAGYCALGLSAVLMRLPVRMLLIAIALLLFGFGLELAQIAVPGRSFEWGDVVANTLGSAFGIILGAGLTRCFRTRLSA